MKSGMVIFSNQPKSLEIRARRIVLGQGEAVWRASVYCPATNRSMGLTECMYCPEFVEMSLDPGKHTGVLKCHPARSPLASRSAEQPSERRPEGSIEARLATLTDTTPISALMGAEVCCVTEEVTIDAFAALLIGGGMSAAPVVDEGGRPIGVVSQVDVIQHHYESPPVVHEAPPTVGDIMRSVTFALNENASVSQAAGLMALEQIEHLPVVDDAGQVVGVLSSLDVLYWLACESGYMVEVVRSFLSRH